MAEQPMIVVRGTAQQDVPPEQAIFTVTVSARDRDRETVLRRIAERSAEVRAVIDAHGVERRETDRMVVYPELRADRREKVVAYAASTSTKVTVGEFEGLGELLMQVARIDQVVVAGPWWSLRPESRAGAEVRAAAVADALRRAGDYAAAVGARVDRLIDIVETGQGGGPRPMVAFARSRGGAPAEPAPELELDPQTQTVSAELTVRVVITEPQLG